MTETQTEPNTNVKPLDVRKLESIKLKDFLVDTMPLGLFEIGAWVKILSLSVIPVEGGKAIYDGNQVQLEEILKLNGVNLVSILRSLNVVATHAFNGPSVMIISHREFKGRRQADYCMASSDQPPVLLFPVTGKDSAGLPKQWPLTCEKVKEYSESFPGVDVMTECRKARQWCIDNPSKRKTAQGMNKFLGSWLGRVQNRGGGAQTPKDKFKYES